MKISEAKEVIKAMIEENINCSKGAPLIMVGHAGIGKTQTLLDVATEMQLPISILRIGSLNDGGDLLGTMYFEEKENVKVAKYAEPEWYTQIKNGGILFLDEVNRAKPYMQDAIMQILDQGRYNNFILPNNCFVVGAINPADENYDVSDFDAAVIDRCVIIPVSTTHEDIFSYTLSRNFHDAVLDFVGLSKDSIITGQGVKTPKKQFTPRALRQLNAWMPVISKVKKNIAEEIVLGCVGPIGLKVWVNRDILQNIPDPDKLLNSNEKYDINKLDPIAQTVLISRIVKYLKGKKATPKLQAKVTELLKSMNDQMLAYFYRIMDDLKYLVNYMDFNDKEFEEKCTKIFNITKKGEK